MIFALLNHGIPCYSLLSIAKAYMNRKNEQKMLLEKKKMNNSKISLLFQESGPQIVEIWENI